MAYSQTIICKLLPSDTGLAATLLAKIFNSANVLRVTTSAGVGWTELGGGEYQFTYASFDSTDAYIEFFNGATYQTSTTVYDPTVVNLTGIATATNVTDAVTAIETYGGAAPWTTATGFATPTNVSDLSTHIDVNLDAKVSTRLATTGYTAPDNATIGTTGSTVATNLNATITSRASATDMATVLADLVDIKNTLNNLDVTVDLTPVTSKLDNVLTRLDSMGSN